MGKAESWSINHEQLGLVDSSFHRQERGRPVPEGYEPVSQEELAGTFAHIIPSLGLPQTVDISVIDKPSHTALDGQVSEYPRGYLIVRNPENHDYDAHELWFEAGSPTKRVERPIRFWVAPEGSEYDTYIRDRRGKAAQATAKGKPIVSFKKTTIGLVEPGTMVTDRGTEREVGEEEIFVDAEGDAQKVLNILGLQDRDDVYVQIETDSHFQNIFTITIPVEPSYQDQHGNVIQAVSLVSTVAKRRERDLDPQDYITGFVHFHTQDTDTSYFTQQGSDFAESFRT